MAFLTFAEAKVVAPPILARKYPAHTVQIMTQYHAILDTVMMTH